MKKKYDILMSAALVFSLVATSCEKSSDMTLPLAVDSRYVVLESTGGSTQVRIYSTSEWNVVFSDEVSWASLDRLKGFGNDFVMLSYAKNYGVHRQLNLAIKAGESADTVRFLQKGLTPVLSFKNSVTVSSEDLSAQLPVTSNLDEYSGDIKIDVEYQKYLIKDEDEEDVPEPEGGWINEISITGSAIECKITSNAGASRPRKAAITLSYTDVYGTLYTTTASLIQNN